MTANTGEIRPVRVRRSKVRVVLRIMQADRWVGDILIDARRRIWRHADAIPRDVVLKVFSAFRCRSEGGDAPGGAVTGRDTGWVYGWQVAPGE